MSAARAAAPKHLSAPLRATAATSRREQGGASLGLKASVTSRAEADETCKSHRDRISSCEDTALAILDALNVIQARLKY